MTNINKDLIPAINDTDSKSPPNDAPSKFEPNAIFLFEIFLNDWIKMTPAKNIGIFRNILADIPFTEYLKVLKIISGNKYCITMQKSKKR